MKLDLLAALNAARAARRPAVVVNAAFRECFTCCFTWAGTMGR
ncbi:hypothetical protein ACIKT0_09735 [Hansschlegelia beijingensis]